MARSVTPNANNVSMLSVLCGLVMDAFIADVISLVGKAIEEVKMTLREDPSHPNAQWMHMRCVKFKLWCATEEPLNYGDEHATLDLLTQAVSEMLRASGKSLPKSGLGKCSVRDFVDRLYKIGMGSTQQSITSPVWAEGSTPYTLRLVLVEAHRQLGDDVADKEREEVIKFSLREAASKAEIHFFPDHPGDRTRRPSIKHWTRMGLGDAGARGGPGLGLSHEAQITREFYRHADAEQREDVNAEWSINDVTLGQYGEYMKRERLPIEWTFKNASEITMSTFNNRVYKWAQDRFTQEPQHWQCRLSLSLAFLLSAALPVVHTLHGTFSEAKPYTKRFGQLTASTAALSITLAREMPLQAKDKNGFRARGIYFTMASTVFLAWIDATSPINKTIKKSGDGKLPQEWTKKHCESLLLYCDKDGTEMNFAATKGFTVPIMIRLGLLEGWGTAVMFSPKKGKNFRVRREEELKKWGAEITKLFKAGSQGAFRLTEMVLGAETAQRLNEGNEFPAMRKRNAPVLEAPVRRPAAPGAVAGNAIAGPSTVRGNQGSNAVASSSRRR